MLTGTTSRAATLVSMLVGLSVFGPVVLHASCHDRDEDRDGVNSCDDRCPDTQPGAAVDANGCECGVLDDDGDGISNCEDRCDGEDESTDTDGDGLPDTTEDANADGLLDIFDSERGGAPLEIRDSDGDGIPNKLDPQSSGKKGGSCALAQAGGDAACSMLLPLLFLPALILIRRSLRIYSKD